MIVTFRNKGVARGHSLESIVKLRFGRSARVREYESGGYTVREVVKQTPGGRTAVLDEVTSITQGASRARYDLTPGQIATVYAMDHTA